MQSTQAFTPANSSRVMRVALLSSFGIALLSACFYDDDHPRRVHQDPYTTPPPAPTATPSASASTPVPPATSAPMLVQVDTDQTMNANGGEGVGVFTEYFKGGHWHVWWTCDTAKTQQSCDFSVSATVAAGSVSNLDATQLSGGFVTSPSASQIVAKSTTSADVHGIRFD